MKLVCILLKIANKSRSSILKGILMDFVRKMRFYQKLQCCTITKAIFSFNVRKTAKLEYKCKKGCPFEASTLPSSVINLIYSHCISNNFPARISASRSCVNFACLILIASPSHSSSRYHRSAITHVVTQLVFP